jgi:hypothetical protein
MPSFRIDFASEPLMRRHAGVRSQRQGDGIAPFQLLANSSVARNSWREKDGISPNFRETFLLRMMKEYRVT